MSICGLLIESLFMQHCLNFLPLPHGQRSFLPVLENTPTLIFFVLSLVCEIVKGLLVWFL
jgi:hypothetical protein